MPSLPLDNFPQLPSVEVGSSTRRAPKKDDHADATFQNHLDRGREEKQAIPPRTDETQTNPSQDDTDSEPGDANRTEKSDPQNDDHNDSSAESEHATSQGESVVQPSVGLSEFTIEIAPNTHGTNASNATSPQDQSIEQPATTPTETSPLDKDRVLTELGTQSTNDLVAADGIIESHSDSERATSQAAHAETNPTQTQTSVSPTPDPLQASESSNSPGDPGQGPQLEAASATAHNVKTTSDNPGENASHENTDSPDRGPRAPADTAAPQTSRDENTSTDDARQTTESQRTNIQHARQLNSVEPPPAGDGTPHRAPGPFLSLTGNRDAQGTSNSSEQVHQQRFLQRVSKAFQVAHERGGPIRLRLHPPELGSLRLEVKVEGNVMVARVEAESTTARTLLLDSLPVLRDRLAQQEIRVDQFDVDLLDQQSSGTSDRRRDSATNNEREPTDASPNELGDETTDTEDAPRAGRRQGDGNLDVVI